MSTIEPALGAVDLTRPIRRKAQTEGRPGVIAALASFRPSSTVRPTITLSLVLCFASLVSGFAAAKPRFNASEIEGPGADILFCNLDGDRLKDAVLVDGLTLSIFFQDAKRGFPREAQRTHQLDDQPSTVWASRMGGATESLLVMTSEGVAELCFTNRSGPPAFRQIIRQHTIIPEALNEPMVMHFPLSAGTSGDWPLLLLPVENTLQVWQHREGWAQVQSITRALDTHLWPSLSNPGYSKSIGFSMSLGDLNGDRRDDLMVLRDNVTGLQTYVAYLQRADGSFTPEPVMTHETKFNWRDWHCWTDINRDGQVDLVKSTWLEEPWFLPGTWSSKVVAGIFLADGQGRIPTQPQQVLRKNDWMAAIPVEDMDGDGFPDLVMGSSPFDSREGMRKMVTAKQLDYTLRFFFFQPGSGYPAEADCRRDLVIHLNRHTLELSFTRRDYFEHFIKFTGDFDGDGKKDLLVKDEGNRISVYRFISRQKGFSQDAEVGFKCSDPVDSLEVVELNGDGVSDLVVKLADRNAFKVFISAPREGAGYGEGK